MMFYFFVKSSDGNVTRRGGECSVPPELESLVNELSVAGENLATAEEYDAQVLGALNAKIEDLEKPAPVDSAE
jgi:hypothetical protein